MKKIIKTVIICMCVMIFGVFTGCSSKVDAQAYLTALLDVSYKNDSKIFVDMELGTFEEATAFYEQGIDSEMKAYLANFNVSEELESEFRQLLKDMFAKVKYNVTDAKKLEDGSYVVTVSYEKMIIYKPVKEEYDKVVEGLYKEWSESGEIPSDDEINELLNEALKDCIRMTLENAGYEQAATTEVRIDLTNNVYTPNQEDVIKLEELLFDTDAVQ